jgi:hypothetical protein
MASDGISNFEELKLLYQEIVDGYSPSEKGEYFFKHFSDLDTIDILRHKHALYNGYIRSGIPSQKERLAQLIKQEEWNQNKEDRITSLRFIIGDNEKNMESTIPQMQAGLKMALDRDKEELVSLLTEKYMLLGTTADELSNQEVTLFQIFYSLRKNKAGDPLYSWPDYESLPVETQEKYAKEFEATLSRFADNRIRELAVMPFFINSFSYSKENIYFFFGKPLSQLTQYQSFLLSLGQRNLSILERGEGSPPDLIGNITPNDIVKWYDVQYSVILGRRNTQHIDKSNTKRREV